MKEDEKPKTKQDFVNSVASKCKYPKYIVKNIIETFLEDMREEFLSKGFLRITGIGRCQMFYRKTKKVSPLREEKLDPRVTLGFRTFKSMKAKMNEKEVIDRIFGDEK